MENINNKDEDKQDTTNHDKPSRRAQSLIALAAIFGNFAVGCIVGYSSPVGQQLQIPEVKTANLTAECGGELSLTLSASQISWFGSSMNVGAMVGAPIAGILIKHFGRKTTMLGVIILFILGWCLIGKTKSVLNR